MLNNVKYFILFVLLLTSSVICSTVQAKPQPRHHHKVKHTHHHHKPHKHQKSKHRAKKRIKHTQSGIASYYGYRDHFPGRRSADGSIFRPDQPTVAHRTLPFGTRVRITNTKTGKSVIGRVTDRGPFHGNRVIDVSYGLAKRLGMIKTGLCHVKIVTV